MGLDFQTQALQQSKIDISWDEDDPGRKTLKRKFTDDQVSRFYLSDINACILCNLLVGFISCSMLEDLNKHLLHLSEWALCYTDLNEQ